MSALGSLVVKLALEYAEYTQGLDKSSQESLKFAQNAQENFDAAAASGKEFFVGMAQGAAAAVAAYVSVGAVIDGLKNSIDSLAELDDMSQKTGSSVENLSRLQKVAAMTGTEFGNVDSAIGKLAKGMATVDSETNKTNKALKALGVSSKDAAGNMRDPSQVMIDVAKNLQNYKDGAGKTALANDLLGQSGADLLPYLNDVAENVDKFTGVATEATRRASELQDKMGLMRTKSRELFDSLASDLLPTFIDFIDALNDTNTVSGSLYKDGAITSWADDSAVGVARLIDVLKTIPGIVRAVGGSFESVYADLKLLSSVPSIPKIAYEAATGGNAIADFKNALAERNKVVEEANNRYVDLWSKPANTMEQAVLARIDARTGANLDARDLRLKAHKGTTAPVDDRPDSTYRTGNAPKNTATAEEISDYEKLTRSINEKIAASEMELTVGHALTESEKIQSKMLADLAAGKIHLTNAERDAELGRLRQLDTLDKSIEANKQIAKLYADAAQVAQTAIDNASKEAYANEHLATTFGMSKAQIEAQTLARLEEQLAQRSATGMTLDEIKSLEKLIEAKKRNAAAVGKIDALEAADKANKKLIADQEKTVEKYDDIFRNGFADMLNNGKDAWGSFTKSLTTTFKTTVADQIYKMFAQPFVVRMVASLLGGSTVSGVANAATSGGISGGMNMLSAGKSLWDGFSGGMASSIGGMITTAGNALGLSAVSAFGTGMAGGTSGVAAMSASAASTAASLGLTIDAAGATAASLGASIGAAIPYIGAALAVAAILKAGFGHGERETTSRGIEGTFGGSGFSGNNFSNWKEEGGWFTGDNNGRNTGTLDSATAKQFSQGYASLQSASAGAARALGLSADSIANYSEKISITLTDDAAKNAEIITKIFTDLGNNLAAAVAPGIAAFSKEGETASATLSRLSGSITTANAWLSVVRQRLFQVSAAGGDAASKLADAFGGLENLATASKSFYELYYTEGERATRSADDMAKALALVNLSMPATKDQLRSLATSLDLNTTSGRAAYMTLLAIAPEFANVADITAKMAKETADKLISTFTGGGLLMPALDAVFLKAGALTSGIGGLTGSMNETQVRTVALATGLSEAQIRAGALTGGMGGLVGSMTDTQVRALALATGLSEAQIRVGALTGGMGGLGGSMNETQVRTLALATGLSEAQIRAGALTSGMGGLVGSMTETQVRTLVLATGLSEAQIRAGALTGGIGGLGGSMTETQVRAVALATGLSEAQIRAGALTSGMVGLVGSMSETQVRALALATGLSEAQIRAGALTSGIGGLVGSMNDTQVRTLALATGLSEAQIRAGALTSGIGGLVGSMSETQVRTLALATGLSEAQIRAGALTSGMGNLTGNMSETQVRTLALATGLSEAQIRAGALTSGMGSMGQAAGTVSTLFLDAKSGLISFGGGVSALQPTFTGAQLSAILLNNQIDSLRLGADRTRIDIAGLGAALAGVNTETFVSTIGLVFDNLATRIQGVIDGIGSERIAVREAALQIINPTVMSKAGIEKGLAGINTKLPSNAGVVNSLNNLNSINAVQASIDSAKAGLTRAYAPIIDSSLALYNQSRNDSVNSLAAFKGLLGTYAKAGNYNTTEENFAAGTKFRAGGYYTSGGQTAQNNATYAAYASQFDTAKGALATYTAYSNEYAKQMNLIAGWQADVAARANAAANAAKAAQLAYTDALQNFAIDASKSVGKLTKLREETIKYYEAQKQLADLMSNSAAGLRGTVADYKYNQLSPEQQFNDLQSKYATAYAMALSTDGEALAGYGDKLNSMLNPLLEKAKEVYGTDSAYNTFAATALARAETIAGRLETLTPTNYVADSLLMLGQIDTTLAALDASSKSAEKLITDAIKAGSDKTAAGLHAVIAALTGQAIPGFASGGSHAGGLRIVGEHGWELESTGPSMIFNQQQLGQALRGGGGNSARLEALVERQTQELANMRAELRAIAMSNATLAKLADRNYKEGTLVRTEIDAPLATVAA